MVRRFLKRLRIAAGGQVWGVTHSQTVIALAILVLAASIFLPAFQIQCAAAKRALQEAASGEVAQSAAPTWPALEPH